MGRISRYMVMVATIVATACGTIAEELPSYSATSIARVGDAAPQFEITSLEGVSWQMPCGKQTLLILFSHTCPDCIALLDEIEQYIESGKAMPHTIAIARGATESEIESFRIDNRYSIDMAADSTAEIYNAYATMYVPRCYVIDHRGIIEHMTYEYSEGQITELLHHMNTTN